MNKLVSKIKDKAFDYQVKAFVLLASGNTFAGNLIPLSAEQQISEDQDIAAQIINIFKKNILPLVEIVLAAYIIIRLLSGLWKGYEEYQEKSDMGKFKQDILSSVMFVIFGGVGLFLLDSVRTYTFVA